VDWFLELHAVKVKRGERLSTKRSSIHGLRRNPMFSCRQHQREPTSSKPLYSMDRLARNLTNLRLLVKDLTDRGVAVQFIKESLTFTGEDSPMANLLLSMLGAVTEFERALILERQREGIALAKAAGKYKGRKPILSVDRIMEIRQRSAAGEKKAVLAREFRVSRETIYSYLRQQAA
jgi:DNA invertase Pin-like site-specific DNA recombinase